MKKAYTYDDARFKFCDSMLETLHQEFRNSSFTVRLKPNFHKYPTSYMVLNGVSDMVENQLKKELS